MINDMLALEHEILDLEAELGYAYKRNKCERDGLVIEYEQALRKVRERLERLHDVYCDENATINDTQLATCSAKCVRWGIMDGDAACVHGAY